MSPTEPHSLFARFVDGIGRRLLRHVIWHSSQSQNLAGQPGSHLPLVVILGREHYSERQKTYPALRARDLKNVLREELAGEPPTLTLFGPVRGDSREVRFFRLNRAVTDVLASSLIVIPESVVLAARLAAGGWADVERQGYRYYLFPDGMSQPAGGALGRRDLVALAAGVDPNEIPEEHRGSDELMTRLRRSLSSIPASTWWACRNPVPRDWGLNRIVWKPIATVAGIMLIVYLALSSIYLQALLSHRGGALEDLAPRIQDGLSADNDARAHELRGDALIELWSGRSDTQQLWAGVAMAFENEATVSRISMRDGRISLSGEAPDASEILAALASEPKFKDVSFDAPVRSVRDGRQNFALSFMISGERTGPGNDNE